MIPNGEGWNYPVVKKLSALLKVVISKHDSDFYCLNCLHSFKTKNKLESYKMVCENKGFCNIIMPSEDTKILEFSQNQKSDKSPFIIYANVECLREKNDGSKNNHESSFTTKVDEYIPSGSSMPTTSSFKSIKIKHNVHRGKDCLEKFCESLREHVMKIINLKMKQL